MSNGTWSDGTPIWYTENVADELVKKQELSLLADATRIVPKLCTKVLAERLSNGQTVLTLIYEVSGQANVIERIVIDDKLRKSLTELLHKVESSENEKEEKK